jgi:PAS domain S-box-containing protein
MEMSREKEEYMKKNSKDSFDKDLVLAIDKNCKIIKFNDECEKISGYEKDNVLNKGFFDFLISPRYQSQWKKIIDAVRENKLIDDFSLPLLTNNGHEIMVSWSSFPVSNRHDGKVEDIGLVGQLVSSQDNSKKPLIDKKIETSNSDMPSYFNEFEKVIIELEKKNKELEKINEKLEKKLEKMSAKKSSQIVGAEEIVERGLYRFSDAFGGLKNREEIHALMQELDEREKRLNRLEKRLETEKQTVNERKNEFIRWREKLEDLESSIESRIKWVENKEKALEKISLEPALTHDLKIKVDSLEESDKLMINELDDCAAIIQRGVFKQVNSSFASLIGYTSDEIVDKSIFDFIDSSGLSGIEQYYFNRLKGDDISGFETVILTNDDVKINVEVNTKPTFFNGEKAEIIVFKKRDIKKD